MQKLREKAAFRNPDEFYFKMINNRTVGGVHRPKYVQCSPSALGQTHYCKGLVWTYVSILTLLYVLLGLKIISIPKRNFYC